MRIARIETSSGLVVNIEIADQEWLDTQQSGNLTFMPCGDDVGIGWTYLDGVFIEPPRPDTLEV